MLVGLVVVRILLYSLLGVRLLPERPEGLYGYSSGYNNPFHAQPGELWDSQSGLTAGRVGHKAAWHLSCGVHRLGKPKQGHNKEKDRSKRHEICSC